MKQVEERDAAEVIVKQKNTTVKRRKSRDRRSAKEDPVTSTSGSPVDVTTSVRTDTPDDIFDMFERYTDERDRTITRCRSIDDRRYTDEFDVEARDDIDGLENREERHKEGETADHAPPKFQAEQTSDYILQLIDKLRLRDVVKDKQTTREDPHGGGDYIHNLIDRLQIREVMEQIQAYPTSMARGPQQSEKQQHYVSQIAELKAKVEQEERKTKSIERKWKLAEETYRNENSNLLNKIASLEIKLGLQESAYSDRLAEEQNRSKHLERRLNSKGKTEASVAEIDRSKKQVQYLEKEVNTLRKRNASLEETMESSKTSYDFYLASANNKIRELEQSHAAKSKIVQADLLKSKSLELSLEKTEAMLREERETTRALQMSEAKNCKLLETERKRAGALEKLNEKMKLAMKKLSKKALWLDDAQQQISALTKELEKRDKVMSSIKSILSVNEQSIPRILAGDGPSTIQLLMDKEFSAYPSSLPTVHEVDTSSADPAVQRGKDGALAGASKTGLTMWDE